ncbi:DUF2742 domain-containing protein [Mycobacterium heckeshornense]|nr:DUF2742 domain-containing protein [Mycobacterium heckeshornense]MCV7034696.1 DUF2742 domain-containing protein [Mycobacterium heckeshornense]PIJ32597.1 DUF2742 domain-containing protein [Mycobacterium heckeshornense]
MGESVAIALESPPTDPESPDVADRPHLGSREKPKQRGELSRDIAARATGTSGRAVSTLDSRQVSWWPVHQFLESVLSQAKYECLPMAGTPAWCALADRDPRKLLALAVAGEHHVLRMETAQEALAEASKAVAAAADWPAIAAEVTQRRAAEHTGARIPRRKVS